MLVTLARRPGREPAESRLQPAEPLWKRVPVRDADGTRLTDFMMIIPGLGQRPAAEIARVTARIERALQAYQKAVVFADLNLALNVLWVSVRPLPGITLELPAVIKLYVPEALLVSQRLREA